MHEKIEKFLTQLRQRNCLPQLHASNAARVNCALKVSLNILFWFFFAEMISNNFVGPWAVVVAQLVEQSLPAPQGCNSNPVICKFYTNCIAKTKITKPGLVLGQI